MEDERRELHDEIREAAGTMSEAEIARVTGVQRETVRKALGK
jgi:DNA-binding GntR family transcriptional regulator